LSCEVVEKRWFWAPDLYEMVYLRFRTCIFKSHLLPSIWSVLVEFRSAVPRVAVEKRKKERKKIDRIPVKPKSAGQDRTVKKSHKGVSFGSVGGLPK